MSDPRDTAFHLVRAYDYLMTSKSLYNQHTYFSELNAAFNLSMCGEFALKAVLLFNGKSVIETHSHVLLVRECGKNKIKIPKLFSSVCDTLYEYEKLGRYDSQFVLDDNEYLRVMDACEKYLDIISPEIFRELADIIRHKLPNVYSTMDDRDVVEMCWMNQL